VNNPLHNFLSRKNPNKQSKLKKVQLQMRMDQRLVQNLSNKKKLPTFTQFKYLKKFFSKKESILIKALSAIILLSIISIGINIYWINSEVMASTGGEYTEGLVGSPQYINPILAQTNDVDLDISYLLFSGLLKFVPDQGLVNDLAESYEISEDQKIYTFHLRQDLFWDDNEKLNAEDILFTIDRIKDPNTKSPLIFNFSGVQTEKIDDYTIKFTLDKPFAPFIESLSFGILPEHILMDIPAENMNLAEYNLKPIGNGPYKIKSLTKERNGAIKSITLIKNDLYHGEQHFIDQLTFKFYPDFNSAIDALNNKNIEGISYLPGKFKEKIFNNRSVNFHQFSLPQYIALFINQNKNDILKDKAVRQGLAFAINKEQIKNSVYEDSASTIDSPILPGYIGYSDDIKKYNFNVEEAKRLLDEAGWKSTDYNNEDSEEPYPFKVRKKDDKFLELTITAPNQTEFEKIAKGIQQFWQQVGIKTNLNIIDANQIQRTLIKERDYEIVLYGEILGYDPDPYPFWHSSQCQHPGLNLSCFRNGKADTLLEEARNTTSDEERGKKYIEFQKIISEEIPAIFLFNPTYTYPVTKKINGTGAHQIIIPAHRFANISNWFIKTERSWAK